MANSITSPDLRSQLNDLRATPAKVRTPLRSDSQDVRTEADQQRIRDVVLQTMRDLHRSAKAFAIDAQCSEGDLSDALNGRQGRRFEAEWIWRQDDEFLRKFLDNASLARGLRPADALAEDVRLLTDLFSLLIQRIFVTRSAA